MKEAELDTQKRSDNGEKRLENITIGELVWEAAPREDWGVYYNPVAVESVDIKGDYIIGIDFNDNNREKKYYSKSFYTESELLKEKRLSKEEIKGEYRRHKITINRLKK